MLINRNTVIIGKSVLLIPYKIEHVQKYHSWMQNKELQRLTGSQPLTLEQEYEMQKSWMVDENKCTFIVLDKGKFEETRNEIDAMIGDTNLFFGNPDNHLCAEAEIMIAEEWARGKRLGKEAMLHMLYYGITHIGVREYVVKIQEDNIISINLFVRLGFLEESRSEVFKEITFSKTVTEEWRRWIESELRPFQITQN